MAALSGAAIGLILFPCLADSPQKTNRLFPLQSWNKKRNRWLTVLARGIGTAVELSRISMR